MSDQQLAIWNEEKNIEEIKKSFAKDLTNLEFTMFVQLGRATGLNPFLREIWAVKFGNSAAQIFVGRDGYRKGAQNHPQYDYHYAEAVYSNDFFESKEGVYSHTFNLKDRGELIGAFCNVKKKESTRMFSVFVEFKEYDLKQSLWKTKPATMIKKVAESQALRMAFQEMFGGTYDESEMDNNIDFSNSSRQKEAPRLPTQIDIVAEPTNQMPFGESLEDKKIILDKALEICQIYDLDPKKDIETIKMICRDVLSKKPTEKTIDEDLARSFCEHKKNKG